MQYNICHLCKFNPINCGVNPLNCEEAAYGPIKRKYNDMKKRNYYSGLITLGISIFVAVAIVYTVVKVISSVL